jgi:hypothetical protein
VEEKAKAEVAGNQTVIANNLNKFASVRITTSGKLKGRVNGSAFFLSASIYSI